ncbi:MAG: outer membrane protein assembly factor BamA [Spirochaetaceae bacterium]|nr:outer membrane protein assembly factor BamA [Spirochaetaceae bacterium]
MFAVLLIFSQAVFAQDEEWYIGKPIERITFEGLRHVKMTDLEGVTEQYVAKTFTDELFWELTGQLYALELFEVINPSAVPADPLGSSVIILFTVVERPFVSSIVFEGSSGLRRSELLDVISLKPNDVINQLKIRVDEQAILNRYLEKGYPDVSVSSRTETDSNGSIKVTFVISEGTKITIEAIQFQGINVFSNNTLQNQLSLKRKTLLNDGAFQEAKLIADRAAITRFYHDRGYIDADITDVTREIRTDKKGNFLTLVFQIYEGPIYTFGGVTFEGNHIFKTDELQKLINSKVGETVNASRLEQDLQRVADLYFENGYIFNTIGRQEQRNTATRTISYTIPIVERGRAHIEKIIVRGNKKTKDYVILREMPLEPGDVFSKTKVMNGLRNLYNLQYFSNVFPETPQGSADSLMDLIINVDEQPTTEIQAGLSFSGSNDPDAFPVSVILKWNDKNFRGTGNILGAEINAAPEIQTVSLQYTHRWIFGLPLSGGFDLTFQHSQRLAMMDNQPPFFNGDEDRAFPDGFSSFEEYDSAGKLPSDAFLMNYEQWYISLGFSTGYRWLIPPFGILGVGGSIRTGIRYNDFNSEIYRAFDPSLRNRNKQWIPSNSLAFSVYLDNRDIYYDPSRGYYVSERFGFYGLLPSQIELEYYTRSDTKAEWFHTLWNWQVSEKWAFKGVFGIHSGISFIFPGVSYEQPIIEDANKLSIDGMFIGRGWTGERLNRGLALWENWAEVRIPIFPGILALDLFFDAAARRPKPEDMFKRLSIEGHTLADDMRYSFGGGLRFALPQFPFRFLFLKRFSTPGGVFQWQRGAIGGVPGDDGSSGIDFVISFAISTY